MAKFEVITPAPGFTGESCGVRFTQGRAEVHEQLHSAALDYFRGAGYMVTPIEEAGTETDGDDKGGQSDGENTLPLRPESPGTTTTSTGMGTGKVTPLDVPGAGVPATTGTGSNGGDTGPNPATPAPAKTTAVRSGRKATPAAAATSSEGDKK